MNQYEYIRTAHRVFGKSVLCKAAMDALIPQHFLVSNWISILKV